MYHMQSFIMKGLSVIILVVKPDQQEGNSFQEISIKIPIIHPI